MRFIQIVENYKKVLTLRLLYDIMCIRWDNANMAQSAEHILGKDEVPGSNPGISSNQVA